MRLNKQTPLFLALASSAALFLSACQTTSMDTADRDNRIQTMMEQAASDAEREGDVRKSLSILEKMYKKNSDNPAAAVTYAAALRDAGYYNRAMLIIKPFAMDEDLDNVEIKNEYASILTAMGNYVDAESAARQAVLIAPESGKAYHILGVVLDAQGHHEQAKTAFNKALDRWEGDPAPLLNNMGLNLASLGFIDDAVDMLRRAASTAPNRREIERNLRIVSALQSQPPKDGWRVVPKPERKPDEESRTAG
jgi:Flp pilus assembly protein TadD